MSKHSNPTIWPAVDAQRPAHSAGWAPLVGPYRDLAFANLPHIPGRHAKPFAAHHPARPVTYDAQGTVTLLTAATQVLDVVA